MNVVANRFNLTPRAKQDLHDIWNYTLTQWNETQADSYLARIYTRFAWLADRPSVGKHRPDICDGYRCFPEGSHLVFYLIGEDSIDIIGIPHNEMDVLDYSDIAD